MVFIIGIRILRLLKGVGLSIRGLHSGLGQRHLGFVCGAIYRGQLKGKQGVRFGYVGVNLEPTEYIRGLKRDMGLGLPLWGLFRDHVGSL